jgi:hypothetical protein
VSYNCIIYRGNAPGETQYCIYCFSDKLSGVIVKYCMYIFRYIFIETCVIPLHPCVISVKKIIFFLCSTVQKVYSPHDCNKCPGIWTVWGYCAVHAVSYHSFWQLIACHSHQLTNLTIQWSLRWAAHDRFSSMRNDKSFYK